MKTATPKREKAGNPNLVPKWSTLQTKVIRIPEYLADTIMSIARQIDQGKVKQSTINQLCLNPEAVSKELTAITGKPVLTVVPDPIPDHGELLEMIDKFIAEQEASWGTSPNQRGEFKPTSRSWDKLHEFREWLKQ